MAYEELKQRHSVVWGTGPYQRVAETLPDIHDGVVEQLAPGPGVRWLDLACGTGAVAERAAAAGASVTGVDLAPVLIRADQDARRLARRPPRGAPPRLGRLLRVRVPHGRRDRPHARLHPRRRGARR